MDVRCCRLECLLKAQNNISNIMRDRCAECIDCDNKECQNDDDYIICGSCDSNGCVCKNIISQSQYIHKLKYYTTLRDELMHIAWHPDRVWDWCFDEDQKKHWNML